MRLSISLALLLAAALAGCAAPTTQRVAVTARQTDAEVQKQLDIVADDYVSDRARLNRVHWQLATQSTALCPKLGYLAGYDLQSRMKGDLGEALARRYGVQEQPTVLSVVPGGPAEKAGIVAKDVVLSFWGLPATPQNQKAIQARGQQLKAGEVVPVEIRRGGQTLAINVEPVRACNYPAHVTSEQVLNAYADGSQIFITRAMMTFARTDDELALVVGHEMAHNTMRHLDARKVNAAAGMVGDIALAVLTRGAYQSSIISDAASRAYSQEFEAEADYVGLYMVANSGYSVQDAPKFWRRMAAANPAHIKGTHTASHPATSYRMVALEEAAKEIDGKRVAAAPLVPVRKDGKPYVADGGLFSGSKSAGDNSSNCAALSSDGQCNR